MRAAAETLFDLAYLITVAVLGFRILKNSGGRVQFRIFGLMTLILGFGDAFHLVPRAVALCTTGLENYTAALGVGKLITSITMTVFYVMLYRFMQERYRKQGTAVTLLVFFLAAARIVLCLFPQNAWTSANAPLSWGIWRNIPFTLLGIVIIVVSAAETRAAGDRYFRFLPLAVALSFVFYIPVVLWADAIPAIGMLMIPKTCMYVWIVVQGYRASKAA